MTNKMKFVVSTIDRTPEYIHTTLASLRRELQGETIHLMVGSLQSDYLSPYQHLDYVKIHPLSDSQIEELRHLTIHMRCCHNYHRCLSIDLEDADGVLVIEDDVIVCRLFRQRMQVVLDEMRKDRLENYILSLYAPNDLTHDRSLRRGKYYASYPAHDFYGTQCIYFPKTIVDEMAKAVMREMKYHPADMIVAHVGAAIDAIYSPVASLAQHIGYQTTGLGSYHTSPTFGRMFPDETPISI